jgi:hypothetical protein
MGGFKNFLDKGKLIKEDENTEKHGEPGIVDYKDIDPEIKKICEYIITEVKQIGVAVDMCKDNKPCGPFNQEWFNQEEREIDEKMNDLIEYNV